MKIKVKKIVLYLGGSAKETCFFLVIIRFSGLNIHSQGTLLILIKPCLNLSFNPRKPFLNSLFDTCFLSFLSNRKVSTKKKPNVGGVGLFKFSIQFYNFPKG